LRQKYRCIHDIVYDVLDTLRSEVYVIKTRLCTAASLPLDRCSELLTVLETSGLVLSLKRGRRTLYVLTDRGYAYLGLYEQLSSILSLPHQFKRVWRRPSGLGHVL